MSSMTLSTPDHKQILRGKVSNYIFIYIDTVIIMLLLLLITYRHCSGNLSSDMGGDHRCVAQRQYSRSKGIQEKDFQ